MGIHQSLERVEIPFHVGVETGRHFHACENEENADAADAAEKDAPWEEADQVTKPQQSQEQENDAGKNRS